MHKYVFRFLFHISTDIKHLFKAKYDAFESNENPMCALCARIHFVQGPDERSNYIIDVH